MAGGLHKADKKLRFRDDGYQPAIMCAALLGVSSQVSSARRYRPGAAACAYSLALSVVGEPQKASAIAITALRRGAGSRTAVIAHARRESLAQAGSNEWVAPTDAAPDLRDLAQQLAQTKPALERAIVDLELRCSLDSVSFARVLGLTTERATARSREVSDGWAADLDPAMMAWLGPGSCPGLAAVLTEQQIWPRRADSPIVSSVDTTGPVPLLRTGTDGDIIEPMRTHLPQPSPITVGELLAAAPAIHDHAIDCDLCSERLRMLTPVRTLVGQLPLADVPPLVTAAARVARRRLPAPLPPSIEPKRVDLARLRVPALGVLVAGLAAVAAVAWISTSGSGNNQPSQAKRVAELVQAAPSSRLLGTPTIVTPGIKTASLANNGTQVINWRASPNVAWISLRPASGRLQPSQSISIAVIANAPATGVTDANITITGDDGSVQTLKYSTDGG